MIRQDYLDQALRAATRAAVLAEQAEDAARHPDNKAKVPALAAAGALWADVARSYTAIAQATPETETTHA